MLRGTYAALFKLTLMERSIFTRSFCMFREALQTNNRLILERGTAERNTPHCFVRSTWVRR